MMKLLIYCLSGLVCSQSFAKYVTRDGCVTNEIDGIVYTCQTNSNGAFVCRVELAKSASSIEGRNVFIPQTIEGRKVRGIEKKAFSSLPWLRSVTMRGLIGIKDEAFANCSNLVAVTIERDGNLIGLRGIGCFAFRNCVSLADVSLTNAFSRMMIGRGAFEGCKSLKRMQLPSGCYLLDVFAFAGCENLLEVGLPAAMEEVYGAAFVGCGRLREIKTAPGGNYVFENGILYDKAKKKVIRCLSGNKNESIRIEEGVTDILDNAFSGCKHLRCISLPTSLRRIEDFAFYGSGLKEVVLPKGLECVGVGAFARTEVELEDRWKYAKEDL